MTSERAATLSEAADWVDDPDGGRGASYGWIASVLRIAERDGVSMKTANRTAELEIHGRTSDDE